MWALTRGSSRGWRWGRTQTRRVLTPTGLAMWHSLSEPQFPYLRKGSHYHSGQLGRGRVGDGQPCTGISVPQLVRLTCVNLRFKPETSVSSSAIWKSHSWFIGIIARLQWDGFLGERPSLTCLKLKHHLSFLFSSLPPFSSSYLTPPGILLTLLSFLVVCSPHQQELGCPVQHLEQPLAYNRC